MSGAATAGRRRILWRAILCLAVLTSAALAVGAWWWQPWRRAPEPPPGPPPGPSDAVLAAADPEVAAAVRLARERVLREPRSGEAWGLLGEVLLANGFADDADACLARAEALDPDEPAWPYLRAYDFSHDRAATFAAARRAVAACQRAGRNEPAPHLFLAERCIEEGDYEQAATLCRRVLDWEPDNARAHLDLGLIALAAGDVEASLPQLLGAADNPATRQTAYTQLAAAYQRRGDGAAAADFARRARQAPPDDPASDPYADRVEQFRTGRQARHRQVKRLEEQGRLPEAIALLREMTADDPSDDHAFVLLGTLLTKTGDLAGGEQALRKAAAVAPGSGDPPQQLAVTLYLQGERFQAAGDGPSAAEKFRAAVEAARRANDLQPDHPQAYPVLALALKQLGRWKEAIESARLALRFRPDDAELHLALGEALAEDGQQAEAVVQLQYACDRADPGDPRPRQVLDRVRAGQKP